jgi:hypothetical protein
MSAITAARSTVGRRIIKADLTQDELGSMRLQLADPSVTAVYVSTEQFDGEPAAVVEIEEALTFPECWLSGDDDDDGAGGAARCRGPRPRCDGGAAVGIDRRRLDAAFHAIGHQSAPAFRRRLATAYDRTGAAR